MVEEVVIGIDFTLIRYDIHDKIQEKQGQSKKNGGSSDTPPDFPKMKHTSTDTREHDGKQGPQGQGHEKLHKGNIHAYEGKARKEVQEEVVFPDRKESRTGCKETDTAEHSEKKAGRKEKKQHNRQTIAYSRGNSNASG